MIKLPCKMTSFRCFMWNVVANLVVMPYKTQDLNLVSMPWPTLLTFSLFRSFLLISFNCPIKWQFNLTVMLLKISFKCLIVCFVRLLITAVDIAYFPPVLFCALFNLLIIFDFWFLIFFRCRWWSTFAWRSSAARAPSTEPKVAPRT